MLKHMFVTTAEKVNYVVNAFNDYEADNTGVTYNIRFREYSEMEIPSRAEQITNRNLDAGAWFPPDADVAERSVWYIEGNYYRVVTKLNAKRAGSNRVEFIKVGLERHAPVVS